MGTEILFILDWILLILISLCAIFAGVVVACRIFWFFQDNLIPFLKSKITLIVLMLMCVFLFLHYNGMWKYLMEHDNVPREFHVFPIVK